MTYIFQSVTLVREDFPFRVDGILSGPSKIGSYDIHLWTELRKKSDWLMFWWMSCSDFDLFDSKTVSISFPEDILSLLSVLYRSSCNKNSQIFLGSSIVPSLFKWTLLLFKCLFMSVILLWATKTFISQLFTSCTLWIKLSVRGTISNIDIDMFFSDFNHSARSMVDLDILLVIFLLLISFLLLNIYPNETFIGSL